MSYSPQSFLTATSTSLGGVEVGSGLSITGAGLISNAGVTGITGAATIKVSAATGPVTITDVGVFSVSAGTGITTNVTTGSVTVTNAGVTAFNGSTGSVLGVNAVNGSTGSVLVVNSVAAGTGVTVSASTGSVTITNAGVTAFNGSTGAVLGVASITGTSNQVTASASTGAVTLSLSQSINTTNTPQFAGLNLTGLFTVTNSLEVYTSPAISANAVTLSYLNGNVFALASNAANITANYTNVPTTTGQVIATSLIITQGATAYIPSAVNINTVSQTIKWQGGSPPTGNANKTDIVSFTFICNGTTTPTVIGSLSTYG